MGKHHFNVFRGVTRNNYLGVRVVVEIYQNIIQPIFMWFKPQKLKTTTIIFRSFVWILYVSRLIWICYEISRSNFILFVDREFIYLLTWSWIMVYPFKLNSWTFGGTFIRHWSINIYFYKLPKFWMTYNFFLKKCINCLSFAHYLAPNFNPPKKKNSIQKMLN